MQKTGLHTELFFCSMLHAQNLFYIHILYTQKGVYSIFEYKTNFEREAFRFRMLLSFLLFEIFEFETMAANYAPPVMFPEKNKIITPW